MASHLDLLWGQEGCVTDTHGGNFLHGDSGQIWYHFNFWNRLEKRHVWQEVRSGPHVKHLNREPKEV